MQWLRQISASGEVTCFSLPDPDDEVIADVAWGRADQPFTSAFWAATARSRSGGHCVARLGTTIGEEIAACLLGGYGIPAEVGLAAFALVRDNGYLGATAGPEVLEALLRQPLVLADGRRVHYRFPGQKARYLSAAIRLAAQEPPPEETGRVLRAWLRRLPGIGWKTSSWIARNWLDADDVAILDIHVMRAGALAGVFKRTTWLPSMYEALEARFLRWARGLEVRPAHLDALIWAEMRSCGRLATSQLARSHERSSNSHEKSLCASQ
jgi:hypothetical protein